MHTLQRRVYENAPIFLQNILLSLEGYRKTKNMYGDVYYSHLIELANNKHLEEEEVRKYQEKELRKLIQHAVNNSPFYKDFYKGIDIAEIQTIEDLKKLPVLDKETLEENITLIHTNHKNSIIRTLASNKTGKPLKFLFTKEDIQKRMALRDFFRKQHGAINLEMKRASFSSKWLISKKQQKKMLWRNNFYMKQRLYSAHYCSEQNAELFVSDLEEYKPDFIDGLPSALFKIAKYINENKIILSFKPIAIFTVYEKLYSHYRREIEEAFGCPIRDQYFSSEGMPLFSECVKGKLHYNLFSGVLESSVEGELIVTCFTTQGTPLIRYNIGDELKLTKNRTKCKCGSIHPVIESLNAPAPEYLQSKSNGKFTSIYFSGIWSDFPEEINKIQFIQNTEESIDVLIEGTENYTNAITESIHNTMEYLFGRDMTFNIRIVDKIPNLTEKDFHLVINNLAGRRYLF
ncbi:phenylacetate--CoA ligase family protein [Planomicrobium sp. CPCC 101110]|uniref:phenylacetate--CoA ligase family protein n=1 Tax=Planomicrobium sp. CPCC 101110 TaxID=2599619 RepID=UPI0011B7C897|nr:phenylacetate--CoA ligase family protein [Planomicrobium sp. CPCC 101110]TWT27893.1 phenylacetate--CoA ligase family protein [Planomicrobium sp. CPCC 101110]